MVDDEFAHYDAAYVLGALTPAERYRYERHLAGCPRCRAAVDAFLPLPGLLSRVPRDELPGEPVDPPGELLPSLLSTAARQRRRARRWVVTGCGVLAAAAASLVLVLVLTVGGGQDRLPPGTPMAVVASAPVHGWVSLHAEPWGTEVTLRCRYDGTAELATWYNLVVTGPRDTKDRISSWDAVPGETAELRGTTWLRRGDIRAVRVITAEGKTVLRLSL